MIKPEDIPQFAGNLDQLEADAKSLTTDAGNIRTDGSNIHSTFQGLSAYYHSPDADQLFATTKPVSTQADSFASDVEKVASALSSYASEVRPIAAKLKDLQTQAATFVASVKGDDDWKYDKNKVDHNNDLLHQVDTAVAAFWAAERTAANKIDSVFGGTQYVGNDGSNKADMYGYTGDQLDGAQVPWGSTEQQSHHWYDVGYWTKSFVWDGLIVDGIWGTIKGLGTLVGFGGLKNFEQAWKGIGELALGLTITQFDPAFLATPDSMLPGWLKGAKNAPIAFAKSMVAWDEWKKNPATAAGSVSFNILTCVIAPLKIGKLGALGEAGEAGTGAKALSALAKVGEVIDPMTYVSKALAPVLSKLPSVSDLATALGNLKGDGVKSLDDLAGAHPGITQPELKVPENPVGVHPGGGAPLPPGWTLPKTEVPGVHPGSGLGVHPGSDVHPVGTAPHPSATVHPPGLDQHPPTPVHTGDPGPVHTGDPGAHSGGPATGHAGDPGAAHPPTPVHTGDPGAAHPGGPSAAHPNGAGHPHGSNNPMPNDKFDSLPKDQQVSVAEAEISHGAKQFYLDGHAFQYGADHWNHLAENLPKEEQKALYDYTCSPTDVTPRGSHPSYVEINGYLRGDSAFDTPAVRHDIAEIDKAMASSPVTEDICVVRGTDLSHIPMNPENMVGHTFDEDSYVSTSLGHNPASAFGGKQAVFHWRVPAGTPAMWVEKVGHYGAGERELLLGRGLQYHVDHVILDDKGQYQIYGEILPKR